MKIIALKQGNWYNSKKTQSLRISPLEISEKLNRCKTTGSIDALKRKVNIHSFIEFITNGLKYLFPTQPCVVLKKMHYRQAIEPLFKSVPQKVQVGKLFYGLLGIVYTVRVGRAKEFNIAKEEIEKRLKHA